MERVLRVVPCPRRMNSMQVTSVSPSLGYTGSSDAAHSPQKLQLTNLPIELAFLRKRSVGSCPVSPTSPQL